MVGTQQNVGPFAVNFKKCDLKEKYVLGTLARLYLSFF